MRARPVRAIAFVAAIAATITCAASATSAKSLVLQKSDVPGGAKRVSFGSSQGSIKIPRTVHGQAAYVAWRFTNGSATETVGAAAGITRSTQDAHQVFVYAKKKLTSVGNTFKKLSLPRYGDEQFAAGAFLGAASGGVVFVRSGARLWEVTVSGFPGFPRSKMLSELKKYAAKERSRAT